VPGTATSNPTTTTAKPTTTTAAPPANTQIYSQPIFWNDLADLDVIRVNNTFYYSASTMHYSPGAPVLQSYDLVNWQYIGHSGGSQYDFRIFPNN